MTTANNNYTIDKKDTRIFYILMFTILAGFLIATFAVQASVTKNLFQKTLFIRAPLYGKNQTEQRKKLPSLVTMTFLRRKPW